jgi:hypothetical protein
VLWPMPEAVDEMDSPRDVQRKGRSLRSLARSLATQRPPAGFSGHDGRPAAPRRFATLVRAEHALVCGVAVSTGSAYSNQGAVANT